jgi:hypothetical protein
MSFVLGHDFGPHDTKAHGPDAASAIINEAMAPYYFPKTNPISAEAGATPLPVQFSQTF